MKLNTEDFRVPPGKKVTLEKRPTWVKPVCKSKGEYQRVLAEHVAQLSALQKILYAANSHAALMIFQAMDAAGKDGAIQHVMSGVNPQGCQVFSFKHPSAARNAARREDGLEGASPARARGSSSFAGGTVVCRSRR